MLYYVPLELLEERYTKSMDSLLRHGFEEVGLEFFTVNGQVLSSKIESGAFLDFSGTNYFKSTQIQKISELFFNGIIKDGDVFFFSDLWFPGIDSIPYMSRLLGIRTRVVGVMHAGSWTPTDFVSTHLRDYCQYIEAGWFGFFDQVYIGSQHHKTEILDGLSDVLGRIEDIEADIHVTGLPFDYARVLEFKSSLNARKQVIYPHRFHAEKGADTFMDMVDYVSGRVPDISFVITSGRVGIEPLADTNDILYQYRVLKAKLGNKLVYRSGLSKAEFYRELALSRVVWSSAIQENFGYSVLEACTLGVTPVLANRATYPEFYPREYLYDDLRDGFDMVVQFLNNPKPLDTGYTRRFDGTSRIVEHIRSLCEDGR